MLSAALFILAVLACVALLAWLLMLAGAPRGGPAGSAPAGPSSGPTVSRRIPDEFGGGLPGGGIGPPVGRRGGGWVAPDRRCVPARQVVWTQDGSDVLVHLDSIGVRFAGPCLLVSVDLETDQTGRSPLVVALALGAPGDPAGWVAATDRLPRGDGRLAARWGETLQDAVWAALIGLGQDHAAERGLAPRGLTLAAGSLKLSAGAPLAVPPQP